MTAKYYVKPFDDDPALACYCGSGRSFGDCCGVARADREAPVGVKVIHGYLPVAECRRLVRYAEKQKGRWLMINDPQKSTPQRPVEKKDPARVTQCVDMSRHQRFINEIVGAGLREHAVPQYGAIDWFEMPYLLRYKVGGKYAAHADADQLDPASGLVYRAADRDISVLVYLNDGYKGGELTFSKLNYTLRPRVGDLVIFPSGIMFKHQSHVITFGRKYALVSWASLKSSRKLFPHASHSPRLTL